MRLKSEHRDETSTRIAHDRRIKVLNADRAGQRNTARSEAPGFDLRGMEPF